MAPYSSAANAENQITPETATQGIHLQIENYRATRNSPERVNKPPQERIADYLEYSANLALARAERIKDVQGKEAQESRANWAVKAANSIRYGQKTHLKGLPAYLDADKNIFFKEHYRLENKANSANTDYAYEQDEHKQHYQVHRLSYESAQKQLQRATQAQRPILQQKINLEREQIALTPRGQTYLRAQQAVEDKNHLNEIKSLVNQL